MIFALFILISIVVSDSIVHIGGIMLILIGILVFSRIPP